MGRVLGDAKMGYVCFLHYDGEENMLVGGSGYDRRAAAGLGGESGGGGSDDAGEGRRTGAIGVPFVEARINYASLLILEEICPGFRGHDSPIPIAIHDPGEGSETIGRGDIRGSSMKHLGSRRDEVWATGVDGKAGRRRFEEYSAGWVKTRDKRGCRRDPLAERWARHLRPWHRVLEAKLGGPNEVGSVRAPPLLSRDTVLLHNNYVPTYQYLYFYCMGNHVQ